MDRRSFLASLSGALGAFVFGVGKPAPIRKVKPTPKDTATVTWFGWGLNSNGTAGLGDTASHLTGPVAQPVGVEFTQISTFGVHCAAIDALGNLYVWGKNTFFALGTGEVITVTHSTPFLITQPGITNIVEVACTFRGTFARRDDGTILYAGTNAIGENGEGAGAIGTAYSTFTALTNWSTHAIARMSPGDSDIAMLLLSGEVWFSGSNTHGEAGDGTTTTVNTPGQWGALGDVVDLCLSNNELLVIRGNGEVWGSGRNFAGCLMDGTTIERHSPVHSTGAPANPLRVFLIDQTSYVIDTAHALWVAGYNGDGAVINNDTPDSGDHISPVQIIIGTKTFKQVVTSLRVDNYALVTSDGWLYAMGTNYHFGGGNQIDASTTVSYFHYTRVWAITGVVDAASPGGSESVFLARVKVRARAFVSVIGL